MAACKKKEVNTSWFCRAGFYTPPFFLCTGWKWSGGMWNAALRIGFVHRKILCKCFKRDGRM